MSWVDDLIEEHAQQCAVSQAAWRAQLEAARDESARQARQYLEERLAALGVPVAQGRFELARRALGLIPDPDAIADWLPLPDAEWTPRAWCVAFVAEGVIFRPAVAWGVDDTSLADAVMVYARADGDLVRTATGYTFVGYARSRAELAALLYEHRHPCSASTLIAPR